MRKVLAIVLALQLLFVNGGVYAQEQGVNTPKPEENINAKIIEGSEPKQSLSIEADYRDPANYPLIAEDGLVDYLYDSYLDYHSIYYKNVTDSTTYSDYMNIQLYYSSNQAFSKDSNLTIEFYKEDNNYLTSVGNTQFSTSGKTALYVNSHIAKADFTNEPYIYMRVGIAKTIYDIYYSDVTTFKVSNPFYSSGNSTDADSYAVISNESINAASTQPTGTFNLKNMNYTMDRSLELGTYQVDVNKPFDIAGHEGKLIQKSSKSIHLSFNKGDYNNFGVTNLQTNTDYQINARLAYSGTKANVWVYDNQITDLEAEQLGTEFDTKIYSSVTNNFGGESDVNGDGKINILTFDIQDGFSGSGGYVGGYFWSGDLYNTTNSNKSEIFYIDTYPAMGMGATKDVTSAFETLAHEFQHMVNFNRNVLIENSTSNMETWLNEGLSMAAEQIYSGKGLSSRVNYYNASNSITNGHSLLYWDNNGDTLSNYSLSYLFGQYIKLQTNQGDSIFKEILNDTSNNYLAVENVVKKYISPDMTFGKLMTNFRIALLLKESTGLYGFKGDPFFNALEEKIYTGSSANLRGGGAVVSTYDSKTDFTVPSNKGADISYTTLPMNGGPGEVDGTPPASPVVEPISDADTQLNGTAESNAIVYARIGQNEIGRTTSNLGEFTLMIPKQPAGTIIQVYAEDATGNVSIPTSVTVEDKTAPSSPIVNKVSDEDTLVTGTAEAGAKVEVSANGNVIGTATVGTNGQFSVSILMQVLGTELVVTVTDLSGNVSAATTLIVTKESESITFLSLSVSNTIVESGDELSFYIETSDNANIQSAVINYIAPISGDIRPVSIWYDGQNLFTETFVDESMEVGKWLVDSVELLDNDGNSKVIDANSTELSNGNFTVLKPIAPLDSYIVSSNESWSNKTIHSDVYIAPGAVLTINSNVTIYGDVYVLGGLRSYGGLYLSGTLKASSVYFGYYYPSNGQAVFTGSNTISSMEVSNRILNEVPFNLYDTPLISNKGRVNLSGATLPFLVLEVSGQPVQLKENGTFRLNDFYVGNSDTLDVKITDLSGYTYYKSYSVAEIYIDDFNKYSQTITGKTQANSTVKIIANNNLLGTSTTNEQGYFEIQVGTIIENSTLTFEVYNSQNELVTSKDVIVKDITAPDMPKVNVVSDKDHSITGTAEAGSKVEVKVDGLLIGSGTAGTDGKFTVTIPVPKAGVQLAVTAADKAGNVSEAAAVVVKDVTGPGKPAVNEVTDKDTTVSGQAEAGSKVEVKVDGSLIGSGTAGTDGKFTVTIPVPKAGVQLAVTAADKAGNVSEAGTVVVKDVTAPGKPAVNEVTDKDTAVSGQAEAGSKVEVKVSGALIGNGTPGTDGKFTVVIPVQEAGVQLTITAADKVGNVSEAVTVVVKDVTAPGKPELNEVTDKDNAVNGQAEPGSKVEVKVNGSLIGSGTAGTDGKFTVTIPVQKAGTEIVVTVIDKAGNVSEGAKIFVKDITAPETATLDELTDRETVLTGTAELGATVIAKVSGTEIGRGVSDGNGKFSITIPKQPAGKIVEVYAVDKAGNFSLSAKVTVKKKLVTLIGDTRYATAVKVSQTGWKTADTVLLVNGFAIVDGLTATPLATAKDAPILLTAADSIPQVTLDELARLKAKEIILIGGEGVISHKIESLLKEKGYRFTRIGGLNRKDTSLMIAKELDKLIDVSTIHVAYGWGEPDALSIAAQAGLKKQPIILADKTSVPAETLGWLKTEALSDAYFIGGEGVVAPAIVSDIDKITSGNVLANRLSGLNRHETNAKVISKFYPEAELSSILVAKSETANLVDALAAGPLAAKLGSPVLLISSYVGLLPEQKQVLAGKHSKFVHQIGGGVNPIAVSEVVK
ncbi:Ig-like domain-containing protein [Neobacillus sp. YX16]|uniref:Ig-like domain-containing protein n=1 Tax=Neobacillus sp. YX16 TaxID=3047874 RepID=UPI0024C4545D|nr:Ig-like domain-containing protein [Neobacillus sp. YX16]WHZ02784.1 Ig-like domain-containing protein [Neobacillus sp. YX16]